MLRDITIGQYYPADSVIHKLDPRVKLFATLIFIISLFSFKNVWGFLVATIQPLFDKWKRTGIILDLYDHLRGTAKCDPDGDPSDLSDSWHIGHDPDDNAKRIDGRFGKGFGTNE